MYREGDFFQGAAVGVLDKLTMTAVDEALKEGPLVPLYLAPDPERRSLNC